MVDTEKQQQYIELRAKGNSFDAISKTIGVSKPTLIKWSNNLDTEVNNYKAIELEALREQYLATKRHRITVLGEQLASVRKELGKRDLSDVPTPKLMVILMRLVDELADYDEAISFVSNEMPLLDLRDKWVAQ